MANLIRYLNLLSGHLAEDIIFSTNIKYKEELNQIYPLDRFDLIKDNLDQINFILEPDPEPNFDSLIPYEEAENHSEKQAIAIAELFNEGKVKIFMWLLPQIVYREFFFHIIVPEMKNLDTYKRLLSLFPRNRYIIESGLISAASDGNKNQLEYILNYIEQNNISNRDDYINEALKQALYDKQKEMVKILLESGAKVKKWMVWPSDNPLDDQDYKNEPEIVKLLTQYFNEQEEEEI